MIERSTDFDLGRDTLRIIDPDVGKRQHATVDELLKRFFANEDSNRCELQILADEVGMGKTFVALAAAYSILSCMHTNNTPPDLNKCRRKILIITPINLSLFKKWLREVGEFVKRCVEPDIQENVKEWFSSIACDRYDELVDNLLDSSKSNIIITKTNVISGGRIRNYDIKRMFLFGCFLDSFPGVFGNKRRKFISYGIPGNWGDNPYHYNKEIEEGEFNDLIFNEKQVKRSLGNIIRKNKNNPYSLIQQLKSTCLEMAEPYIRNRLALFDEVYNMLKELYKEVCTEFIPDIPLVIVDEAHNWKNEANGFKQFCNCIAPKTRRLLLLTATPFQLRPSEILNIMKASDYLKPSPSIRIAKDRCDALKQKREEIITNVLKDSEYRSMDFQRVWTSLPENITEKDIEIQWNTIQLINTRKKLHELAVKKGKVQENEIKVLIETNIKYTNPELKELIRYALLLFTLNADLSQELGEFVIRHRRSVRHRLFKIGNEFPKDAAAVSIRRDRHILHPALGLDVSGDGELPHYLLMKCVSLMKGGKGRTSLGNALTGAYSTLFVSSEGRKLEKYFKNNKLAFFYYDFLRTISGKKADNSHPKISEVTNAVVAAWKRGEKSLIFCFRVNNAERLNEIIERKISTELNRIRGRCLGGENSLKSLRTRLTGRERDLVILGLDRVFYSFLLAPAIKKLHGIPFSQNNLTLDDDDLHELARLALIYKIDLTSQRVDRVFLHRAVENIFAGNIFDNLIFHNNIDVQWWRCILDEINSNSWIEYPYGIHETDIKHENDVKFFDERGVHTIYKAKGVPTDQEIDALWNKIKDRRNTAHSQKQISIFDTYIGSSSLWNYTDEKGLPFKVVIDIHTHLYKLTLQNSHFDWKARLLLFKALRKVVFRESVLLRLLPERSLQKESQWSVLLTDALYKPLKNQNESMAHRIESYLEDIFAASGDIHVKDSSRFEMLNAQSSKAVALVKGDTNPLSRERFFNGFNTPLTPEVLICTSVGQEGIDLHRQCCNVIHYDLAWNPAVIEQRTGRADRIGSKTFRERSLSINKDDAYLTIGVPFLAGTYDERMYEELCLRAQTFEVLTGGDFALDNVEGFDDINNPEDTEKGMRCVSLPESMLADLRVDFSIYKKV